MNGRFAAVVWDVDGVLIDSEPLHFDNIVRVCRRHGYAFTDDDCLNSLGVSFAEMWRDIPGLRAMGVSFDEVHTELIDRYVERVRPDMARGPAPAIVAALAGRGVPQAAASSSPRRIVEANIAAIGVAGHLRAVLGREDVAAGKPAPDLYLAAAERLNRAAGDCLAVEDTATGVASAKAAGLAVIAWPHAMTAGMDFSNADHVVSDLAAFDWARVVP